MPNENTQITQIIKCNKRVLYILWTKKIHLEQIFLFEDPIIR